MSGKACDMIPIFMGPCGACHCGYVNDAEGWWWFWLFTIAMRAYLDLFTKGSGGYSVVYSNVL